MKKFIRFVPFLIATMCVITAISCKTTMSPSEFGGMKGSVGLDDSAGVRQLNAAGVTVQIRGTSIQTRTDSLGNWQIEQIPTGTYEVLYSKSGFGSIKTCNVQIPGPGDLTLRQEILGMPRTDLLSVDSATIITSTNGSPWLSVFGHPLQLTTYRRTAVILISPDTLFSQASPYTYLNAGDFGSNTEQTISLGAAALDLHALNMPSGSRAYVTACCGPYDLNTDIPGIYDDCDLNHAVMNACGPHGNVISVTIP